MPSRVVFMGSPEFALPTLRALMRDYQVAGVVTQPDRPAGRGRALRPPPVKVLAQEAGIPLIQPRRLSDPAAMGTLRDWSPDVIVVAAFGQILRPGVLELPPHGCVNVHASLLPRWRGASPVQAAILSGDTETGVTIMRMDAGVDTGPVISLRPVNILPEDTAAALGDRLATLGADLLTETLPGYLSGRLAPRPQDGEAATYAPMLKKSDGELDPGRDAGSLARQVRAFDPWPGSFIIWDGQRLKVHRAHAADRRTPGAGVRTTLDGLPAVGAETGILVLDLVQPEGKRKLGGKEFLAGRLDWTNDKHRSPQSRT